MRERFDRTVTARLLLATTSAFVAVAGAGGAEPEALRPPAQDTTEAQICRLDWNHDGRGDLAIFAPAALGAADSRSGERGHELVVMYETDEGYGWQRLSESVRWVEPALSCRTGDAVTGTAAGPGDGAQETFATGGSYIEVAQPEGAVVAYFWDGAVREVWTAD
ncbi:MAG: hypothetical protein PVI23_07560 [Maricaulaceae bacterium]|jgi:hypothetical protein